MTPMRRPARRRARTTALTSAVTVMTSIAAGAVATPWLSAQQAGQWTYAEAEQTVGRALSLQAQGNFDSAYETLLGAIGGCNSAGAEARNCYDLVYFSLGYLLQSHAANEPDPDPLLRRAIDYYTEVASAPDTGATGTAERLGADAVYNLSLLFRTIGPQEWQESHYRVAPDRDVERRALHYTFLGDFYAQTGRPHDALKAYRAAAQADPDGAAPREGLLDVYRLLDVPAMDELFALAQSWEPRFPELAARAYEAVIERNYRDGPDLAERALVRYVWVVSRGRGLDSAAVARLPADWQPVVELAAYVESPDAPRESAPWWLRGDEPPRALARVALGIGQREVSMGRPEDAERTWSAARQLVDVTTAEALDLKRELALLYFRHAALDPDGSKFDRLEQELFDEKGEILAARNLEAAQRYHSMLGQIYAERQVWRSRYRGRNAVDQLTWALQTAERRDAAERFRQPLPELRALLASGYAVGVAMADDGPVRALHHEAAVAFLDSDDLDGAAASIARSAARGTPSSLADLLTFRARLRDALAAGPARADALCSRDAIDHALRAVTRTEPAFAARQRFKLLADCAEAAPPERRAAFGAEAIRVVVQDAVPLVGIGDVLRLENATAAVRERAVVRDHDFHVDVTSHGDRRELRISLAGQTRPGYVSVTDDIVVAARVIGLIGDLASPYRIQVRDGAVTFDHDPTGVLTSELSAEIGRLDGVTTVRREGRYE
jgi:tetratricopeptide (TPR) repeat protein